MRTQQLILGQFITISSPVAAAKEKLGLSAMSVAAAVAAPSPFLGHIPPRFAIEAAIELNLDKVEAGAQGEHKIQRGYLPVTTYCSHYILDVGFRQVIEDFLVRETAQVELVTKLVKESGPFKDGNTLELGDAYP